MTCIVMRFCYVCISKLACLLNVNELYFYIWIAGNNTSWSSINITVSLGWKLIIVVWLRLWWMLLYGGVRVALMLLSASHCCLQEFGRAREIAEATKRAAGLFLLILFKFLSEVSCTPSTKPSPTPSPQMPYLFEKSTQALKVIN